MVLTMAPIATISAELSSSNQYEEDLKTTFQDFVTKKYSYIVDDILQYKFGDRDCLMSDDAILLSEYETAIKAYLITRWRFIKQAMDYLDTEYNPIENYQGTETEVTTTFGDERNGRQVDSVGAREDKYNYAQHTDTETPPSQVKVSTTSDKTTTENKVAPFESSDYYSKEQTTVSGQQANGAMKTEATTTYGDGTQGSNQTTTLYGSHEDKHNIGSQTINRTTKQDSYRDEVRRQFDRHGNLGQTTASQMLTQDSAFWKAFRWLDDLAQDVANILAVSVWVM